MSKFQVGDKVRTYDECLHGEPGCAAGWYHGRYATVGEGLPPNDGVDPPRIALRGICDPEFGGPDGWAHPCCIALVAGSYVPDVDGNPIRVGQLVERVVERPGDIRRVRVVQPQGIPGNATPMIWLEGLAGCYVADQWRVLTADDLLRPVEPATRDVELRVTYSDVPGDITADGLRRGVERVMGESSHPAGYVVEVVE